MLWHAMLLVNEQESLRSTTTSSVSRRALIPLHKRVIVLSYHPADNNENGEQLVRMNEVRPSAKVRAA